MANDIVRHADFANVILRDEAVSFAGRLRLKTKEQYRSVKLDPFSTMAEHCVRNFESLRNGVLAFSSLLTHLPIRKCLR
jgi:hypothetical protein